MFLLFFNIITSCYARSVKFIQVTDVHLTQSNSSYLEHFVQDVNENFKDLDFIVFTGDNIDKANWHDLELFLKIVNGLKTKVYIIPGNHDLFQSHNMSNANYMKVVRNNLGYYHSNKVNYAIKKGNVVFMTMNGVKEVIPGSYGYYRQNELIWLDKKLKKYRNKNVVILQHFPILSTNVKNHNLYRKEDYEEILKKHNNIIAIVSGHYHENREQKEGNIYHIVTKNFSNNTFYKLIEIYDDNIIFTYLIDKTEK